MYMFGAHITDRDHDRLMADLDFLRMDEPARPARRRHAPWRVFGLQTGGMEHVGAPLGRLASVNF
jgi:hypothetical protein